MKLAAVRKYKKKGRRLGALFSRNPVLVLGLDLPFVIACSTTLKNGVALSLELLAVHLITVVAAFLIRRRLPLWGRILVTVGISTVAMTVARYFLRFVFAEQIQAIGMYFYLMAVNGLTIYQCNQIQKKSRFGPVFSSAALNAVAFALTMVIVSALREYIAFGALWGVSVPSPIRLTGASIPFFGFILMGFLLAFTKFLNKRLQGYSIAVRARRDMPYPIITRR